MNIFYFDPSPSRSAKWLCDKHIVKMPTETVQILSTAYFILTGIPGIYKPTHMHHPCVKWASSSRASFVWLLEYAECLGIEYTSRYRRNHLAIDKLTNWIQTIDLATINFPTTAWTDPPQCMPVQYHSASVTDSYKNYYVGEKQTLAVWSYSKRPHWM